MARRRTSDNPISLFSFQDIITSVTGVIILVTLLLAVELTRQLPAATESSTDERRRAVERELAAVRAEEVLLAELVAADQSLLSERSSLPASEIERSANDIARREQDLAAEIAELQRSRRNLDADLTAISVSVQPTTSSLEQLAQDNQTLEAELELLRSSRRIVYNQHPGAKKAAWLVDLQGDRIVVHKVGRREAVATFSDGDETARVSAFLAWAKPRSRQREYFVLLIRPESISSFEDVREALEDLEWDLGFDLVASDAQIVSGLAAAGDPP